MGDNNKPVPPAHPGRTNDSVPERRDDVIKVERPHNWPPPPPAQPSDRQQ
jgi:hypothetical protein